GVRLMEISRMAVSPRSLRRPLEDRGAQRRQRQTQALSQSIGLDLLGVHLASITESVAAVVATLSIDDLDPAAVARSTDAVVFPRERREVTDHEKQGLLFH